MLGSELCYEIFSYFDCEELANRKKTNRIF